MNVKDIFQVVLIKGGHFIVPPDKLELDIDKFLILVKNTLSTYNRWCPRHLWLYKDLKSTREYTFTESNTSEGIPDNISEVIPARIAGVVPYYWGEEYRQNPNLDIKKEFPIVYRKPTLNVPLNAEYDILAIYKHKVTVVSGTEDNQANTKEWEITTIDEDDDDGFFDLLTARFLKALGKSRRAFTVDALQITSDASEMVSDAETMEEKALEDITENKHKFWLAYS